MRIAVRARRDPCRRLAHAHVARRLRAYPACRPAATANPSIAERAAFGIIVIGVDGARQHATECIVERDALDRRRRDAHARKIRDQRLLRREQFFGFESRTR